MKQAGGETLYLKVDRNVQVHDKKVTIGDLAQILCTDKQTENLVKTIKVPQATNGKPGRNTMSVMELIERIQEEVSGLERLPHRRLSDTVEVEVVLSDELEHLRII